MRAKTCLINKLKSLYSKKKNEIIKRLNEFKNIREKSSDEDIFKELCFCLLTPQSKAKSCWEAICIMNDNDQLLKGRKSDIRLVLKKLVRFHNKKADYLLGAREIFKKDEKLQIKKILTSFSNAFECREWLVKNLKGIGYKEAGHFLRNIGFGEDIAILDRHILRNLYALGVIDEMPVSLSKKKYLEIEQKMKDFSEAVKIPLSHLDLLLWYKETGEIFK
jgi:N-glycosylase/DNA lyase